MITIFMTKQVCLKDAVLHLLLYLNEDFDDDLLLDAINMIFG